MPFKKSFTLCIALLQAIAIQAQDCPLTPSYAAPVVADGWQAQLIHQELDKPRSLLFDGEGGILVVEQGKGIKHLRFTENGSCFSLESQEDLVKDDELNHGLALANGTLYASTPESVYTWPYDASSGVVGTRRTVVSGMANGGHSSRTLLLSEKQPGVLVVSRGSEGNIDLATLDISSGHSQIKAFDLNTLAEDADPFDFNTQGGLLGWGLRNSVGVAEEPIHGGIYSVENSADQVEREGISIHQNNPGEEMNYHGYLNGSKEDQGGNYGYPICFAVWNTDIPNAGDLKVGDQFSLEQNATVNDTFCNTERVAPILTFQAHMAPLDIIFEPNGTEAFVSFHGSWNRDDPIGYKVSSIAFSPSNGRPTASSDSTTSTTDIMSNADLSACPDGCFRPVGLARDSLGRIFMTSDSTGEIWVVSRTTNGGSGGSASPNPTRTSAGGAAAPTPTESGNAATGLKWDTGFRYGYGKLGALLMATWALV